jgi:DNA-binding XRE family transcriptional regulator
VVVRARKTRRNGRTRIRRPAPDFLDELIAEEAKKDRSVPAVVDATYRRRELLRRLVQARIRARLTQAHVAERMHTSQAAIARIESGDLDVRTTTLDRYAAAIGKRIEFRLSAAG